MLLKLFDLFLMTVFLSAAPLVAAGEGKLNVVATTTFNADLVRKIGGDHVAVKSVASPRFNVHFIQPRPSDVRNVAKADLYVNSGLDLEIWSDPLVEAAGRLEFFRGGARSVDLSNGIRLLKAPTGALSRSQGDVHLFGNPHYHLSPENAKLMAKTLLGALKKLDPSHAPDYEARTEQFVSELDRKISQWKSECAHCLGKEVYAYHDEVEYLTDFLGLKSDKYLEPKPGIPPTPRHLGELERYAAAHPVSGILQTSYFPKDASEALGKRIGAPVILIAHNVGETPGASDIFSLYGYDVKQISEALK